MHASTLLIRSSGTFSCIYVWRGSAWKDLKDGKPARNDPRSSSGVFPPGIDLCSRFEFRFKFSRLCVDERLFGRMLGMQIRLEIAWLADVVRGDVIRDS